MQYDNPRLALPQLSVLSIREASFAWLRQHCEPLTGEWKEALEVDAAVPEQVADQEPVFEESVSPTEATGHLVTGLWAQSLTGADL